MRNIGRFVLILWPLACLAAGLPPYRPYRGPIRPGLVITRENLARYEAELKRLLPVSKHHWYLDLGVRAGRVTMPIVKLDPGSPLTKGVLEATRRYGGRARVSEDNRLMGWVAGVPFPHPRDARELAWNCYPSVSRASCHDDLKFYAYFKLFKETNYEKHFTLLLWHRKYRGRTDVPPLGDMEAFRKRGVLEKESILITKPFDIKGFIQLRVRYWDIDRDDDNYAYLPALRRMRRLTGSDVTDPMLGSDLIWDDYEVWRQKLTSRMTFRVLEHRDFLVPKTYVGWGLKRAPWRGFDYARRGPCFQVDWELRPLWVMEILIHDPDYAYSKRVVYLDALPLERGGTFMLYWGEQYDQRGRLWRANGTGAPASNPEGFRNLYCWMYMDVMRHHYSGFTGYPVYVVPEEFRREIPLREEEVFTIKGLLRRAR